MMSWGAPAYAWLLPAVVAAAGIVWLGNRRRERDQARLAAPHLLPLLLDGAPRQRPILSAAITCFALVLLVVALMRPQWGMISEERSSRGLDIIIAVDVSRSMLADDVPPNRLALARQAIDRSIARFAGDRVGILAFAGSAFSVCPLTTDHAIVRQVAAGLRTDTIPRGGSSIAAALAEARRAFRGTPADSRVLIVVSDGEDLEGGTSAELDRLRRDGIILRAAVVGTGAGGLMPVGGGFVKDTTGAVVKSRARPELLKTLDPDATALDADGKALSTMIDRVRSVGREREHRATRQRLAERFQIPLAGALLLMVLQPLVSGRGRG